MSDELKMLREDIDSLTSILSKVSIEVVTLEKKLEHHDAVLYKLGVALYDRKLANKENKLPLGVQEKLEDAWDKRKADNFQENEDG